MTEPTQAHAATFHNRQQHIGIGLKAVVKRQVAIRVGCSFRHSGEHHRRAGADQHRDFSHAMLFGIVIIIPYILYSLQGDLSIAAKRFFSSLVIHCPRVCKIFADTLKGGILYAIIINKQT